jgi:inhibitor of cysteine peptidase
VAGPSVANIQFTSVNAPHSISGTVSGSVSAGVLVSLSGAGTATTLTASDGTYTFSGLADGTYQVTPALAGYSFSPVDLTVTLAGADATGVDFVSAPTHVISGYVSGDVMEGVKITLSGAAGAEATTDVTGHYAFTDLPDGGYVLSASLEGYAFDPQLLPVDLAGADVTTANFTSTLIPTYTVSGTISGPVVDGVSVALSGAAAASTATDGAGAYVFTGLPEGSYMVIPSLDGYAFTPASRAFRINGADVDGQDFTSAVAP